MCVHIVTTLLKSSDICTVLKKPARSHSEMEQHLAKQAAVEKEESKRSVLRGGSPSRDKGTGKSPGAEWGRSLSEEVPLRAVWVEQAAVLIQQVSRVALQCTLWLSPTLGRRDISVSYCKRVLLV